MLVLQQHGLVGCFGALSAVAEWGLQLSERVVHHCADRCPCHKCDRALLASHVIGFILRGVMGVSFVFASCTYCKCIVAGAVGSRISGVFFLILELGYLLAVDGELPIVSKFTIVGPF